MMPNHLDSLVMACLARREYSQYELCHKFLKKGFSASEIRLVLDRLALSGLQSDERFTRAYVDYRSRAGFGPLRIAMELKKKGIDDHNVHRALECADIHWPQLIRSVLKKKYRPDDHQQRDKQFRFLQQRGFRRADIKELIK